MRDRRIEIYIRCLNLVVPASGLILPRRASADLGIGGAGGRPACTSGSITPFRCWEAR